VPQLCAPSEQPPAPSHVPKLRPTPAEHVFAPHVTVLGATWHAFTSLPLHEAPQTDAPPPAHGGRVPTGCVCAGTGEHVPTEPVTLHDWHCAVHAELQHTPSTQYPLPHSPFVEQLAPFVFVQLPACPGMLHA
jgi:hypothetical protein